LNAEHNAQRTPPPAFLAANIREQGSRPPDTQVTEKTPIAWARVFRYLLPYWRAELVLLVAMALGIGLSLVYPLLIREIVDKVIGPGLAGSGSNDKLLPLVGLILAASTGGVILSAAAGWLQTWVTARVLVDIRLEGFRHLQKLGPAFFARRRLGDILSRMGGDLAELQQVATGTLIGVIGSVITLVAVITALTVLQPLLLLIGAAFIPIAIAILVLLRPVIRRLSLRVRERSADISHHMLESLSGLRAVLAHGLAGREADRFEGHNNALVSVVLLRQLWNSGSAGAFQVLVTSNLLAVLVVGVGLLHKGQMTAGDLLAFLLFQQRLYGPLQGLAGTYINLQRAAASVARVFELLDAKPLDSATPPIVPDTALRGKVDFRRVHFTYGPGREVLHDITFTVPPGTTTAVVGPSGAGKSTLIDLLFRFVEPASGTVSIDDIDLRQLELPTILPAVALVSQEPVLFGGSLRDNLRWLEPDASDSRLRDCLQRVGLDDFEDSLPEGLDTALGDRGIQLSAGQKQRVGLARALVRDPVLLVLDEVTSALDWESDNLVLETLAERRHRQRTTLVVSHRLQLAASADQVLVVENGRIRQQGCHKELIGEPGLYTRLWQLQRSESGESIETARNTP